MKNSFEDKLASQKEDKIYLSEKRELSQQNKTVISEKIIISTKTLYASIPNLATLYATSTEVTPRPCWPFFLLLVIISLDELLPPHVSIITILLQQLRMPASETAIKICVVSS